MTPRQEMRVLVGLVMQPLVAAAAAFVLFPALDYTARALDYTDRAAGVHYVRYSSSGGAVSVAFGAALAAVFVVVFGALPAIGWVSRRRPITLGASLVAGALLGNLPGVVILLLAWINNAWASDAGGRGGALGLLRAVAFGSSVGIACGAAFWVIAGNSTNNQRRFTASHSPRGVRLS